MVGGKDRPSRRGWCAGGMRPRPSLHRAHAQRATQESLGVDGATTSHSSCSSEGTDTEHCSDLNRCTIRYGNKSRTSSLTKKLRQKKRFNGGSSGAVQHRRSYFSGNFLLDHFWRGYLVRMEAEEEEGRQRFGEYYFGRQGYRTLHWCSHNDRWILYSVFFVATTSTDVHFFSFFFQILKRKKKKEPKIVYTHLRFNKFNKSISQLFVPNSFAHWNCLI